MTRNWFYVLPAILLAIGCSRSAPISVAATAGVGQAALSANLPSLPGVASGSERTPGESSSSGGSLRPVALRAPSAASAPAPSAPEMVDLFAPPKVVVPVVTKEPEVQPQVRPAAEQPRVEPAKALPQLRLVGFVEMEGLKALLSVEGKLNVVTIGDSADGLQILAIEPPAVTMRHGAAGEEFQINLYDQPWFHKPSAFAQDRRSFGGKPVMPVAPAAGRPTNAPGIGASPIAPAATPPAKSLGAAFGPPEMSGPPGIGAAASFPGLPGAATLGLSNSDTPNQAGSKGSSKNSKSSSNAKNGTSNQPPLPGGVPGLNGLPPAAPPTR